MKTLFAALAAVMTIGAVSPAMAWDYGHCNFVQHMVSNTTLARECNQFIVDRGIISKGFKKGEFWQDAFSWAHFKSPSSSGVVERKVQEGNPAYTDQWFSYKWQVNDEDAIKTKQLNSVEWKEAIQLYKQTHN